MDATPHKSPDSGKSPLEAAPPLYRIDHWSTVPPPSPPANGELHLWHIGLDGPTRSPERLLSADEQTRCERFLNKRDRDHFIRARVGLRSILGAYLHQPPQSLIFAYRGQGKPALSHPQTELEFNLSHTGGLALLAITRCNPVGIDLEQIRERPNAIGIAKRLFPQPVQQELEGLQGDALNLAFLHYWTAMEASLKCRSAGVFSPDAGKQGYAGTHFQPHEGWLACVAGAEPLGEPSCWKTFQYP